MATSQEPQQSDEFVPRLVSTYLEGDITDVHTQNDPDQPFQRENIIERRHKVDVRCQHKDIVHGFYSDDDDYADPCSLVVFEFEFSPNAIARRIKAVITIEIKADTLTQLGSVFKTDSKDDPVFYGSGRTVFSTNHLRKYDVDNLGRLDLKSLADVTLMTMLKGAIKEM
ncbi:hypothetical protein ACHAPY_010079 [Fusarium culmorum]